MDARVNKPKAGLRQRHAAMTHGLGWDLSYQPRDKVQPIERYEGIVIHDWQAFADPLHLTVDAYWKLQGEKDKKLYAVMDAFAQNNGPLGITDARYVNALKLLIQVITPQAAYAHRGFAHLARQFGGDGLRVACALQSADALRHHQSQTHALSAFNKYFNGLHSAPLWFDRLWYLAIPKSYAEDAYSAGPFETLSAISFSFDYLLSDLLYLPFMSGAAQNGDLCTVGLGFSMQGDAARHRTLGLECIRFMLQQDAANLPIVQGWIDKWFWRGHRLMTLVAMMQDYMLPKRGMSWRQAWELYVEQPGTALFADLARYGIRLPSGWADAGEGKDHISHQAWGLFYNHAEASAVHTWVPQASEQAWLAREYPNSFDRYYRPRLSYYAEQAAAGKRFRNPALPMQCALCQWPMCFTEPGDPRWTAYRETEHEGERQHFCSSHCQAVFEAEPAKHLQARLATHQILRDEGLSAGAGSHTASIDALAALRQHGGLDAADGGDFDGSDDQRHFADWGGGQDAKEAQI